MWKRRASAPLRRVGVAFAILAVLACGAARAAEIVSVDEDDDDGEQLISRVLGAGFGADPGNTSDAGDLDTEPLLVHPLWVYADPGLGRAMVRMPAQARQLLSQAGERAELFDFAAAHTALEQARRITQQALGDDDAANLMVLLRLADLERTRKDPRAALVHYRAALALAERSFGARSPWLPSLLWYEAGALLDQGDLAALQAVAERASAAVAARGGAFDERIALLNNNAIVRMAAGDLAAAQRGFEAALEQLQAAAGGGHAGSRPQPGIVPGAFAWLRPRVLSNLGLVHWYRGDGAAALGHNRRALAERAPWRSGGGLSDRAEMIIGRAAAQELDAVVTLERDAPPATRRLGLTALFERKGALLDRQARGMASLRESASAPPARRPGPIGTLFGNLFDPKATAQRQLEAMVDDSQRDADRELLRSYQQAQAERAALEQQRAVTVAEVAERQRAIARADRRLQHLGMQVSQQAAVRPLREQMLSQIRQPDGAAAARLARLSPEEAVAQASAAHFERSTREREAMPDAVRAAIPADAVLVEMLVYRPLAPRPGGTNDTPRPARYAAYLLRRDAETRFVDIGDAQDIDRLVIELRRQLARPTSLARVREAGRKLDAVVMQPLRPQLGAATQLLLAPEGLLNLLPFGALVGEDGRFLVERYQFNYLASGRDLLRAGAALPPRTPPLILADPDFGAPALPAGPASAAPQRSRDFSGVSFDPLPGTAAEAAAIRPTLAGATLLTGAAATETALKAARGPRLLHLATHGFFLESDRRGPGVGLPTEDAMLRSGLVFAGVNALRSGQDDGVLTALEAAGLDLAGTQLVVLSACDTGLGEVQNGEGVFGMRRAFVVAGAQTLVMSLWEVEDDATRRLMVDYYGRLVAGEGRVEALRRAQLAMLADAKVGHPFFWAAFIASGQAGALP